MYIVVDVKQNCINAVFFLFFFLLLIFYNCCFKSEGRSLWADITKGNMRTTMAWTESVREQPQTVNSIPVIKILNVIFAYHVFLCHKALVGMAFIRRQPFWNLEIGGYHLPFCIKFHPLVISEMIILTFQELWVCMSTCKDTGPHSCARWSFGAAW